MLAGAAVTDLALSGAIESRQERLLLQRVHAVGDERPTDSLLVPICDAVEEKPRGVQTVLADVGPRMREPALERLVARADLAGQRTLLGSSAPPATCSAATHARSFSIR